MKTFTCIQKIVNKGTGASSYILQDNALRKSKISEEKLKYALSNGSIQVTNLKLQNNVIISIGNILGAKKDQTTTIKTACGHEYYIMKNIDSITIYIPDDVEDITELGCEGGYGYNYDKNNVNEIKCPEYYSKAANLKVVGGKGLKIAKGMFCGCEARHIDFSDFTTSNVLTMRDMFFACEAESLDLSTFDTSNVIDMVGMFYNCNAKVINFNNFNTSNVVNMCAMFAGAKAGSLALRSFDTLNVKNFAMMFSACESKSIDLSSFNSYSAVTTEHMFDNCFARVEVSDSKIMTVLNTK